MSSFGKYASIGSVLVLVLGGTGACSRDARLAGHNLRKNVAVRSVSHYGITLDEAASPEQVAYVFLRAVRDDSLATDMDARERALDRLFDLCAANVISARNQSGMSRDEFLYHVVYHWTPTVSHYVGDFEEEWEEAAKRMVRVGPSPAKEADAAQECQVFIELDDPGADPNARVVLVIYLAQDSGYWRVLHAGFDPTRRSIRLTASKSEAN